MRHLAPCFALALVASAACSTGSSVVGGPPDAAVDVTALDRLALDTALDAPVDAPVDAPFRCATNADCAGRAGPACDVATGACVQCVHAPP